MNLINLKFLTSNIKELERICKEDVKYKKKDYINFRNTFK